MKIAYYEMSYEDIPQISGLEREFFSTPWSEESIAHYAEAGNTIFVVARPDGSRQVAGYAALLCAADEGNLVSIGVHRDFREMKIATELLDILYDMARERGVSSIHLEVRESNEPAIRLYEREGFTKVGKRPAFYRNPAEDALLYVKHL